MASSDFWQRLSTSLAMSTEWDSAATGARVRNARGTAKLWIFLDVLTVLIATALTTAFEFHITPLSGASGVWRGNLFFGHSMWILLAMMCGFTMTLIVTSRRMNLYTPARLTNFLHEQRLSAQACFTSGLLLTGALYMVRAIYVPRSIVLITVILVAIGLGLRRFVYRVLLYRRFDRGLDTRNVLIVGTGPEAQALRNHLESIKHLGYTFKGFVDIPGSVYRTPEAPSDVICTLDSLFQSARKQFIDEIFFAAPCERRIVQDVLEQARLRGVDLRLFPEMYDGIPGAGIEYIGQFPTMPLHRGQVPELGLFFKRVFDTVFSVLSLIALSPLLGAVAIAIKLDSPGPVFYASERIGKK